MMVKLMRSRSGQDEGKMAGKKNGMYKKKEKQKEE